ncbi:hypothetical protein CI644P5_00013 [Clostridium phage CI644P5]|nr:hypothetical protein CI644P2_00007 [Clostridium phage CI644P2]WAX11905.1 hypothetical protein CI644P3_00011 [Clostridium phage CI644P3]WAX11929.1 hypothetical protein CI644P4_00012 [Clostridium phage CI644P4]WAX11954.1 hypothetical protein CI644P5_00013 [Clostridium phage CI644P5]
MKTLKELAKEQNGTKESFIGRTGEKIDSILGKVVTLRDYEHRSKKKGNNYDSFIAFIVDEDKEHYYNGGTKMKDFITKVEEENMVEDLQREGVPILMKKTKTSNGNTFTNITFYPPESELPF